MNFNILNKICGLLTLIVFCNIHLTAQTPAPASKTAFALIGGVNFQTFNGKDMDGSKLDYKMITGYHVGFNILIPLVPDFYFQPGLLLSVKGAMDQQDSYSSKYKLTYIEAPLNFVYRASLGSGKFLLGFGPYIGYGIKGKVITETSQQTITRNIKFKNTVETTDPRDVPYVRAFDAGGNIFAGYELSNGIFFQFNTQLGMLNINPEYKDRQNDKTAVKNTGFGLSAGYRF